MTCYECGNTRQNLLRCFWGSLSTASSLVRQLRKQLFEAHRTTHDSKTFDCTQCLRWPKSLHHSVTCPDCHVTQAPPHCQLGVADLARDSGCLSEARAHDQTHGSWELLGPCLASCSVMCRCKPRCFSHELNAQMHCHWALTEWGAVQAQPRCQPTIALP